MTANLLIGTFAILIGILIVVYRNAPENARTKWFREHWKWSKPTHWWQVKSPIAAGATFIVLGVLWIALSLAGVLPESFKQNQYQM